MDVQVAGLENFVGDDARIAFMEQLEPLLTAIPDCAFAHVSIERAVHGVAMGAVMGVVIRFYHDLLIVLAQDKQGWWNLSEMCPACYTVRSGAALACGGENCSFAWPEQAGLVRVEDLLPAHYDDNTFSGHVKISRERWDELATVIGQRLELGQIDPLNAQLYGQATALALRDCVTAWSAPNRIGFAWGTAPA